jgi:hypothetical protein
VPKYTAFVTITIITGLVIAGLAIYALITFPRSTFAIPVSFTVGADVVTMSFEQPFWADKVQIKVLVESGASLWHARILNQNQIIWEHTAGQGEQTSFESDWISLSSGNYTFTFGTIGVGSLDAEVTVTSKGGFW